MRTTLTTLAGVAVITLLTAFTPAASATHPAGPPATAACPDGAPACLKVAADGSSGMLTAKDLQEAYRLPSGRLGGGQTIAVVVPYGHTTAEADLAVYREGNGLPPLRQGLSLLQGDRPARQ
ncbi:hypothetical protein AB0J63_37020 [Streptosporangium canum]|uniref:hypothetical protein n=1 Tax=Streptosporangium canum TaxID=324952 RepID=UPI0034442605